MSLQGITGNPPMCTCGADSAATATAALHSIGCYVTAWTQPHAMFNMAGEVFYPDNDDDARHFAEGFDAQPMRPDVFPFNLGGQS